MSAGKAVARASSSAFAMEDQRSRELMRDLHEVRPAIYWSDFLMTALAGWAGFAMAVMVRPFSPGMFLGGGAG